ncbi:hypothetical protein A4G31_01450 [Mycobacterium persicum]|nr:hypothetical protein A4G31_01450 [Mycobacterium persicum]
MVVSLRVVPEGLVAAMIAAPDPVFSAVAVQPLVAATHGARQPSRPGAGIGKAELGDGTGDGVAATSRGVHGGAA